MDDERRKPARQTLTYLRDLFHERGMKPKNKLGQNFLIDLNLVDFAVNQAELSRDDMVLEVGTGTGSLTAAMADHAGAVLSVEIDQSFHDLARETVGDRSHVQLVHGDVLKNKNLLQPFIMEKLHEGWKRFSQSDGAKRLKLVSNLPYAVATPVISNLLLSDLPFERMVVTVQWEIAERLIAAPGSREYGALAILVQSLADVELARRLAPAVFWPRPKVNSAIIRIWPRPHKRAEVGDLMQFRVFLRELYAHRRKNLRGGLLSFAGKPWDKATVDQKFEELGIDGNCRAETLDRQTHLQLSNAFSRLRRSEPEG